jgi:hypothetical protein
LNKEQTQRLEPFLHRKSARQRVILYLLAEGFTVGQLVTMSVSALRTLKLPIEMQVRRDEVLEGRSRGSAFLYPNGTPLPHTAYYRIVRGAAEKVLGRPMSQELFRAYIKSEKKG